MDAEAKAAPAAAAYAAAKEAKVTAQNEWKAAFATKNTDIRTASDHVGQVNRIEQKMEFAKDPLNNSKSP